MAGTEEKKKLCFIVGPIGAKDSAPRKRSDKVRRFIIDPAMAHLTDWEIVRADQIGKPGMIDRQIIIRLRDADLVIADLATSNPNAFYEIGIRHVFGKPTVHIQDAAETIPFDVGLYSSVMYSMESVEDIDAAVIELKKHVDDAIDPNHEIDNPVTRTLGHERFSAKALPEAELLRAELASLKDQVDLLTKRDRTRRIAEALAGDDALAQAKEARVSAEGGLLHKYHQLLEKTNFENI